MMCVRGCPFGERPWISRSRTIRTDSRSVERHLGHAAGTIETIVKSLLRLPLGLPVDFLAITKILSDQR
jgi:hypothetical protein